MQNARVTNDLKGVVRNVTDCPDITAENSLVLDKIAGSKGESIWFFIAGKSAVNGNTVLHRKGNVAVGPRRRLIRPRRDPDLIAAARRIQPVRKLAEGISP